MLAMFTMSLCPLLQWPGENYFWASTSWLLLSTSFRGPYNNPALGSFRSADSRSTRCYGGNLTYSESSKLYGVPAFSTSGLIRNLKNVSEEVCAPAAPLGSLDLRRGGLGTC